MGISGNRNKSNGGRPGVDCGGGYLFKGLRNFGLATAYKAMLHNAGLHKNENPIRPALKQYLQYGFIPNNDRGDVWGAVATTLEYCFADWNLAQMAKALKRKDDYKMFAKRSLFYKNLYDSTTGFMRPMLTSRPRLPPFDPLTITGEQNWVPSGGPGFVEGSAWQYSWFVPHDIIGLKKIMGGDKKFTLHLQIAFDSSYFELWNEPDMAYPYLFNYVNGEEWRAQKLVRENIKKYFNTTPAGLPGNDDCGTMSAWLVFGMMGFYPDCPGSVSYAVTLPAFEKISIALNHKYYKGKFFVIKKTGAGNSIATIHLNKQIQKSYFINHRSITNGGQLTISTRDQ